MFPMTPIAASLALFLCVPALAAPMENRHTPRSLLEQAKGLPGEFEEHFFDVPLVVQVELDQQFLGEAGRSNHPDGLCRCQRQPNQGQ
jgi:hypothetical protein